MFLDGTKITEVYLCTERVDFRKGINGLSQFTSDTLQENPLSGHVFVFTNRRRDKIKILYWERNGFCLWQKRLERSKYSWPRHLSRGNKIILTREQLQWLLEGFNLKYWKPHPVLHYEKIS